MLQDIDRQRHRHLLHVFSLFLCNIFRAVSEIEKENIFFFFLYIIIYSEIFLVSDINCFGCTHKRATLLKRILAETLLSNVIKAVMNK